MNPWGWFWLLLPAAVYTLARLVVEAWFHAKEAHLKRLHRDWCGQTPDEEE